MSDSSFLRSLAWDDNRNPKYVKRHINSSGTKGRSVSGQSKTSKKGRGREKWTQVRTRATGHNKFSRRTKGEHRSAFIFIFYFPPGRSINKDTCLDLESLMSQIIDDKWRSGGRNGFSHPPSMTSSMRMDVKCLDKEGRRGAVGCCFTRKHQQYFVNWSHENSWLFVTQDHYDTRSCHQLCGVGKTVILWNNVLIYMLFHHEPTASWIDFVVMFHLKTSTVFCKMMWRKTLGFSLHKFTVTHDHIISCVVLEKWWFCETIFQDCFTVSTYKLFHHEPTASWIDFVFKHIYVQFNGLDWSLLVKHLVIKDIHAECAECVNTFGWRCESETRVPSSRGLVKQYNQELCISLITFMYNLNDDVFSWNISFGSKED